VRAGMSSHATSSTVLLGVSSVLGLVAFSWPFLTPFVALSHGALVSIAATLAAGAAIAILLVSIGGIRDPRTIALIGVLSALAAAARLLSVGAGGIELIFVVVILAGRVLGPRAGFAVGALGLVVSSMMWGGFGPWTPFQMLAVGWVAAGAGVVLPSAPRLGPRIEVALLAGYAVVASYLFGLLMNLWFWPLAIGPGTSLSLVESDGVAQNVARFALYSLATSTLTWDTVRALTMVLTLTVVGTAALKALRRVVPDEKLDREVLGLGVVEHERVG
jgi:hypothetical protein